MKKTGDTFALPEELGGNVDNYSLNQMKTAIVRMLEKRPNNSCKKDHLTKLVFQYIGVRPRGTHRNEAARNLMKAMGQLVHAKVVKKYQATNKRFRLSKQHEQLFQRHIQRMSKRKAHSSNRGQVPLYPLEETGPLDDLGLETSPAPIYVLPPLPEPLDDDENEDEVESDLRETGSKSPMVDDDDEHLFAALIDPTDDVETPNKSTDKSGDLMKGVGFQELVAELDQLPGVTAQLRLGEIDLLLDVNGEVIRISLVFDTKKKRFSAIAFFPLVQRAAVPMLKLFGMQELNSSLTIGIRGLEEQFLIKEFIPWDSESTIQNRIQEFLREVVVVAGEFVKWK